jgi:excisionase family DNA binding protein
MTLKNPARCEVRRLLTTTETAEILGIGKSTLEQDRLYSRLKIPFIRLGRSIRYRREDIEAYLQNLKAFTSTSQADEVDHGRS